MPIAGLLHFEVESASVEKLGVILNPSLRSRVNCAKNLDPVHGFEILHPDKSGFRMTTMGHRSFVRVPNTTAQLNTENPKHEIASKTRRRKENSDSSSL